MREKVLYDPTVEMLNTNESKLKSNQEIWGEAGSEDFNEIKVLNCRQGLTGRRMKADGPGLWGHWVASGDAV